MPLSRSPLLWRTHKTPLPSPAAGPGAADLSGAGCGTLPGGDGTKADGGSSTAFTSCNAQFV
jgi:hypothetical protein